ncbi:MAG TPA: hypothetical protein VEG30_05055 [Terriglobales bacterium]|nr:hypothetical protein [Terriglobales bacterium]
MHRVRAITLLILMAALTASAGSKEKGTTTLRDLQPAGTTDKHHKNQQYDLSFATQEKQYTCRTKENKSVKATDFIVGSDLKYEIKGNKGKVTGSSGKEIECTIVRVSTM